MELPFEIGALYSRRGQIHSLLGGQQQGGIATPAEHPVVVIFTGEAGEAHGYSDYWDEDGYFHYFGEGQSGDMEFKGGNRAILDHVKNGKRLIAFQSTGKGKPYRYRGEFIALSHDVVPGVPDTSGALRNAIVFKLRALEDLEPLGDVDDETSVDQLGATSALRLVEVRTRQTLFRRRLLIVERGCRLTGITDLRFLRASHIKPWAMCDGSSERTDGNNGLLLAPQADFLFDRGWISFSDDGKLLISETLPDDVSSRLGLGLVEGKQYGTFDASQQHYMKFHRANVFLNGLHRIQLCEHHSPSLRDSNIRL